MQQEIIHKEIDLIQAIITRMANNSFLLKGWLVSLIAVILALNKDSLLQPNNVNLYFILIIPVFIFWYLDAYFLQIERRYRELYKWVIKNRSATNEHLFDLNHKRFKKDVANIFGVMFSETLIVFYLLPLLFLIFLILKNKIF